MRDEPEAEATLNTIRRIVPILLITEGPEGALSEVLYQTGLSRDGNTTRVPIPDADRWAMDRVLSNKRLAERVLVELCRIAPEFVEQIAEGMRQRERMRPRVDYSMVQPVGVRPMPDRETYIPQAYPKRNR